MLIVPELNVLFLGLSTGVIRVYLWPVIEILDAEGNVIREAEFTAYATHLGPVTCLEISVDHQYLFTAGEDGVVFVLKLYPIVNKDQQKTDQNKEQGRGKRTTTTGIMASTYDTVSLDELALVPRLILQEKQQHVIDLEFQVQQIEQNKEFEITNTINEYQDQIQILEQKADQKLSEEKNKKQRLEEEFEAQRQDLIKEIEKLKEEKFKEINKLEEQHNNKLTEEFKRYKKLQDEFEDTKIIYSKELMDILASQKESIEAVRVEYMIKLDEAQKKYDSLYEDLKKDGRKFEVVIEMNQKEQEKELEQIQNELRGDLEKEKENSSKYQQQIKQHEKSIKKLEEDQQDQIKQIQILQEKNQQLEKIKEENDKKLQKLEAQLQQREDSIKSKENTISDLRAFNVHLQNFRFVLDQKIRSLKEERIPMEEQVTSLQQLIKAMYKELLEEYKEKTKLEERQKKTNDLKTNYKKKNEEIRHQIINVKRKLTLLQNEIAKCLQYSKEQLPFKLREVYDNFIGKETDQQKEKIEGAQNAEGNLPSTQDILTSIEEANTYAVKNEVVQQRNRLHDILTKMQANRKKQEKERQDDLLRKQKENAALIQECNDLRENRYKLTKELAKKERDLKDALSKLEELKIYAPPEKKKGFDSKIPHSQSLQQVKETPYMQYKKGQATKGRLQKVLPQQFQKQPSVPSSRLSGLVGEIELNKQELMQQNLDMRRLQEQVAHFIQESNQQQAHYTPGVKQRPPPGHINQAKLPPLSQQQQQLYQLQQRQVLTMKGQQSSQFQSQQELHGQIESSQQYLGSMSTHIPSGPLQTASQFQSQKLESQQKFSSEAQMKQQMQILQESSIQESTLGQDRIQYEAMQAVEKEMQRQSQDSSHESYLKAHLQEEQKQEKDFERDKTND